MAQDFAMVRIVKIKDKNSDGKANIEVKALEADHKGDVKIADGVNGTDVLVVLAKKFVDAKGPAYAFNAAPACVVPANSTASCTAGQFPQDPAGFSARKVTDDSIVISVPQLPAGGPTYKYSLFLTATENNKESPVTIDPKITNGGAGYLGKELLPPSFGPAGLSGNTLFLLTLLIFAAGCVIGRAWARSEQR
jgi:hypothetical protein